MLDTFRVLVAKRFDSIRSFVIGFKVIGFKTEREHTIALVIFFSGLLLGWIAVAILEARKSQ
jgi:hypothetical protein